MDGAIRFVSGLVIAGALGACAAQLRQRDGAETPRPAVPPPEPASLSVAPAREAVAPTLTPTAASATVGEEDHPAAKGRRCSVDRIPMTGFCRVDLLEGEERLARMTMRCGKSADICGEEVRCDCADPVRVTCASPSATRVREGVRLSEGRCEYVVDAPEDGACKVVSTWSEGDARESEELIAFGGERRVCGGRVPVACNCAQFAPPAQCQLEGVFLGPTSRSACRVRWSGCEGSRCAEGDSPLAKGEAREFCGKRVACDEKTATLYPDE